MKREIIFILALYTLLIFSGSLCMAEEKTLVLGSSSGWGMIRNLRGVEEVVNVRPNPVIAISSTIEEDDPSLDIALSFDEGSIGSFRDKTGRYALDVSSNLAVAGPRWARFGAGAAVFSGARDIKSNVSYEDEGPLVFTARSRDAMLFSGQALRDFTMEFWLYPMIAENGERILSWSSTRRSMLGQNIFQRIQCGVSGNKVRWHFMDFFASPGDDRTLSISVTSSNNLVPRIWSHHLIRFDSNTGMLEYLINGKTEGIAYATSSGREGGDVYNPAIGDGGRFVLGTRFSGMMDEFRAYSRFVDQARQGRYPSEGGHFLTEPFFLGDGASRIMKIEVFGGRLSNSNGVVVNEYTANSGFSFPDAAALRFFVRAADTPYFWTSDIANGEPGFPWIPVEPGRDFPQDTQGRWVQLAVLFYPSGNLETTPYIDEMRIHYVSPPPPPPPMMVQAAPSDRAVDLSWRSSAGTDVVGYIVYYGTSAGEYFGREAILGPSPIDVGKRNSIRIDGLDNGKLYYFVIAAYTKRNPMDLGELPHIGEFSREVSTRPLRMVQ